LRHHPTSIRQFLAAVSTVVVMPGPPNEFQLLLGAIVSSFDDASLVRT
jgi:hypothetical protein